VGEEALLPRGGSRAFGPSVGDFLRPEGADRRVREPGREADQADADDGIVVFLVNVEDTVAVVVRIESVGDAVAVIVLVDVRDAIAVDVRIVDVGNAVAIGIDT
jgi:hypothetical protein